jgi:hypothetical protein
LSSVSWPSGTREALVFAGAIAAGMPSVNGFVPVSAGHDIASTSVPLGFERPTPPPVSDRVPVAKLDVKVAFDVPT